MIVANHHYHGIVATAHDRLGPLIEDLTEEDAVIYVHNPPRGLFEFLQLQYEEGIIKITIFPEKLEFNNDGNAFTEKLVAVSKKL